MLLREEEAKISVLDRGFLFGDSIYEVTDTIENHPIFLDEHFDRLWRSAGKIGLEIPFLRTQLKHEIDKTLNHLNVQRAYIRLMITRGVGDLTLSTKSMTACNLIIITKELQENPSWWYEKGVEVIIANTRRTSKETVDPSVKSGNYLNNVMAYNEAVENGAFDAIMLNQKGDITEGTTSNIWMIKDSCFYTPPLNSGLLGGITRMKIIEILKKEGLQFQEKTISKEELKSADEVFLSASTKKIVPIIKIDDVKINNSSPGENTQKLSKLYFKLINESIK